ALELNVCAEMLSEVPVCVQHVSLEIKLIGVVLFAPIVVTNLLQNLTHPTANAEVPAVPSKGNVLQGIPEIPPERCVLQKAPVFAFAQKRVDANRFGGTWGPVRLGLQSRNRGCQRNDPSQGGSHSATSPQPGNESRRCIPPETGPSRSSADRSRRAHPGPRRL